MKNILLLTMMLCASTTFATVRTVSNQTPNPGQYTTIQAAINASSAGDTVYVHGSPIDYSVFALDRQLTIIGAGFQASSANVNPYTNILGGGAASISSANASGSKIIGLSFYTNLNTTPSLHDITISRCYFQTNSGYTISFSPNMYNVTISENYFINFGLSYGWNGSIGTPHDFIITNNIFRNYGGGYAFSEWNGVSNVQVSNNLFYGNGTISIVSGTSSTLAFSNNIFNKVGFTGLNNCTFSNNLTYLCSGNTPWINNGTDLGAPALGTQNISNTSPDFVNQTNINSGVYGPVNYYGVNPGSPTLSSMAGDPDMGPYGGSGSYDFRKASASTLPYVYSLSIGNPTIQSGTNLNINVIGKKHD